MNFGRLRGKSDAAETFPGPERPIAQHVKVGSPRNPPRSGGESALAVGQRARLETWACGTFNWKITANLLLLREIGVYHTATAA
jgi:hypothetical protein